MTQYSESIQMYLKTILELEQSLQKVRCVDIANTLGISKPSVTKAIKKLRSDGLVEDNTGTRISLTPKGSSEAALLCEKSVILKKLFMSIGADADLASEAACKTEHILNEEMLDVIRSYLLHIGCNQ